MHEDSLQQRIQTAYQRLETLIQSTGEPTPQAAWLAEAIAELSTALEGLQQTAERLYRTVGDLNQRNQELLIAQRTLEAERQYYQDLFEALPDGYLVTDPDGVIQRGNQAAANLLNLQISELVGQSVTQFVAEADRDFLQEQLIHLLSSSDLKGWEMDLQGQNQPIPVAVLVTPKRIDQKVHAFYWLLRDISQARKVQDVLHQQLCSEQELSDLKSRLIQTLAHEFRTSLGVIRASAQLLERHHHQLSVTKQHQYFDQIQTGVASMTKVLNDMIIVDEVQARNRTLTPEAVDVELFCRTLVDELQGCENGQATIRFTCHGHCGTSRLDPKLLYQILSHLLSNALKYSAPGSEVQFDLMCQDDRVVFRVRDDGIGISPEDCRHLLEPLHGTQDVESIPAIGLGLAIVKSAVNLHKGHITVEGQGQGTTFSVTLPLISP